MNQSLLNNKKIIAFDVDGTLSEPRQEIDSEMSLLLKRLLQTKKVAIISGGAFEHIEKQVLIPLNRLKKFDENLYRNLILLPTNGGGFYIYNGNWQEVDSNKLSESDKTEITKAINEAVKSDVNLQTSDDFGLKIQDRESEITYSALGENAPVNLKKDWDSDFKKRIVMQKILMTKLPNYEVKIGGTTSIDITPKGMDKAYGIKKLLDHLNFQKSEALFFGDAVYENGNDFPVKQMGVETIKVNGPKETEKLIREMLE